MPFTVITLKTVPSSLRGDLTKWMQEIATGVYVGNFNSKVREELWERVTQNVSTGEATMSFSYQNEIGYQFETCNTIRIPIDYDGIPLVQILETRKSENDETPKRGFSDAARFRHAKRNIAKKKEEPANKSSYVVVDIETDGLNIQGNSIIEIGAIKVEDDRISEYHSLIQYEGNLPKEITKLTGLTVDRLKRDGIPIREAMAGFLEFIGSDCMIGYNVTFDLQFLNNELRKMELPPLRNKVYDVMKYVKKEKIFLKNYRLETVLQDYGINEQVPHRAVADAKLIYELSQKVNEFLRVIG